MKLRNVDINAKDNFGVTALLLAAIFGKTENFKYLYDQPGIERHAKDCRLMNSLHLAVENSHSEIIKVCS